jgi:hypothetical protein
MPPRRASPAPLARRILTCVLLGLLLNAGVTAVCWLTRPAVFHRHRVTITLDARDSFDHNLLHTVHWFARERSDDLGGSARPTHGQVVATSGFIHKFGFPFRSLQYRETAAEHYQYQDGHPTFSRMQPTTDTLPLWQRGLPTGLTSTPYQRLPIDPVLPGFLLNTLVYAALPALVLTAVHIRARKRRRQSRCPACGYELAGLPTCPECGRLQNRCALSDPWKKRLHI